MLLNQVESGITFFGIIFASFNKKPKQNIPRSYSYYSNEQQNKTQLVITKKKHATEDDDKAEIKANWYLHITVCHATILNSSPTHSHIIGLWKVLNKKTTISAAVGEKNLNGIASGHCQSQQQQRQQQQHKCVIRAYFRMLIMSLCTLFYYKRLHFRPCQ